MLTSRGKSHQGCNLHWHEQPAGKGQGHKSYE